MGDGAAPTSHRHGQDQDTPAIVNCVPWPYAYLKEMGQSPLNISDDEELEAGVDRLDLPLDMC